MYSYNKKSKHFSPMFIMFPIIFINLIRDKNNLNKWTLSAANLINNAATINIADIKPNIPISLAIASNFYYKGVVSSDSYLNKTSILPTLDASPTTITMKKPSPVMFPIIFHIILFKKLIL